MTDQQDLTPAEIGEALVALKTKVGEASYLNVCVTLGDSRYSKPEMSGVIYPNGLIGKGRIGAQENSWRDLIATMNAKWEEARDTYESETRRRMALAIIETTYALGECSDNALRGQNFSADEVRRLSVSACELANSMAERGPFSVVVHGAANEAEAA